MQFLYQRAKKILILNIFYFFKYIFVNYLMNSIHLFIVGLTQKYVP